jgi:hypothetical protein
VEERRLLSVHFGRLLSRVRGKMAACLLLIWWNSNDVIVLQSTLSEHLSSPPVFSGVRFTRSLVLCVCFVNRCLSFCTFSFGHCVVSSSSIYGFWLPLLYLETRFIYENEYTADCRKPKVIYRIAKGHVQDRQKFS